jgi:hypothetical protein
MIITLYEDNNNGELMYQNLQKVLPSLGLGLTLQRLDHTQRHAQHDFTMTPALLLDDSLLIEGDTPAVRELTILIDFASQMANQTSDSGGCSTCSTGSCGSCGSTSFAEDDL